MASAPGLMAPPAPKPLSQFTLDWTTTSLLASMTAERKKTYHGTYIYNLIFAGRRIVLIESNPQPLPTNRTSAAQHQPIWRVPGRLAPLDDGRSILDIATTDVTFETGLLQMPVPARKIGGFEAVSEVGYTVAAVVVGWKCEENVLRECAMMGLGFMTVEEVKALRQEDFAWPELQRRILKGFEQMGG